MKKNINYSKNDLLFYYHKQEFPQNLILKETLTHRDLLFSEHAMEPETINKKKPKLAMSFILEEELESKKVPFKKGKASNVRSDHNITKGNAFGTQQNTTWRKNEFEDPGFFDNFKGKSDERQVNTFKRNMELQSTQENSFCINNALFVDYLGNNERGRVNSLKEITATADDLFNNSDNLLSGNNESYGNNGNKKIQKGNNTSRKNSYQVVERKTSLNSANNLKDENCASPIKPKFIPLSKEEKNLTFLNQDPKKIDFRNIHRINKYLNYGKEEPLWYIFHPIAKSSFGPCSSENLEEMYSGGMVDGQSEVRFIDIYNIKNKKPFEFFKLKDLEDARIIDDIEISSLVRNAVLLNNHIEGTRSENYFYNNNNYNTGNNYNNNQSNRNSNNNNQNKNKKHRKNSSNANNAQLHEGPESNKDPNPSANAKVNSPNEQQKETKKSEKKEPKDLNSLLEKVLKNDIKNKEKKSNTNVSVKVEENKPENKESTPPTDTKAAEKESAEISNIPSLEEVINKENGNKLQKEKVSKNKKSTKAKPVGLDIKLKFEDSSANQTTPSNLASSVLSNINTKPKTQKDEKPKTTKAKDSALKKEEILENSIYNTKLIENPEFVSNKSNSSVTDVKKHPANPHKTGIETIQVTYDDSIYNINYGYDQEYYNEFDYYGSGNKNNANQANIKKNTKKQNKKNSNPNDKNDYYGYDYQYDEGYGNNNYQASNKNYYNNYGGYGNKQNYRGNNNNYEY